MDTYIPRVLETKIKKSLTNHKVLFLIGARQVGKTTLINHIFHNYSGHLLNMDWEIDRDRLRAAAKLDPIEAIRSLGADQVLVIDEAHRVKDIGRIAKGWYDARVKTKIILLGSSSVTLLNLAAAELTGRNEKLHLTPLLFSEVLNQQRWYQPDQPPGQYHQNFPGQIKALLLNRLVFGNYPESYLAADPQTYLTNLISDYLLKDMFTASLIRNPKDVRRLLLELAGALGQTISGNQLATRLNISRQTVERYLDLLEGIFVIFSLPSYHTDSVKEISRGRKYYFLDNGVKNALQREWTVSTRRSDINQLFENFVISEIFKQSVTHNRHEDLFFWQSRNDSTVELVIKQGRDIHPFNIRFHPHAAPPSRAFANQYNIAPQIIHPGNLLEYLR